MTSIQIVSPQTFTPAQLLAALLQRTRLPATPEVAVQEAIAAALTAAKIDFQREHRLSTIDRIDFFLDGLGIEVKIKGPARGILRQLRRYADHADIDELMLVSSVAMGLPKTINGKPVHIVSLGRAWL